LYQSMKIHIACHIPLESLSSQLSNASSPTSFEDS
jgi:hypothetical protein